MTLMNTRHYKIAWLPGDGVGIELAKLGANITLIAICISVDEPLLDIDQISRFLITAESANIQPLIILTKIDLIKKNDLNYYVNK